MKLIAAFIGIFLCFFLNSAISQSKKMLVRTLTGVKIMDLSGPVPVIGAQIPSFGGGGGAVEEEVNIMTDQANNILFLTAADAANNITVLNSSMLPMQNGIIRGDNSSLESAICKIPCTTDQYYFFNYIMDPSTFQDSIFYSIIDMSLNGGLGAVTQKNIYLGSGVREGMTISHQMRNGCRWLLVPGFDTANNFLIKEFKISNSNVSGPIILDTYPMASSIITPHEIELSSDNLRLCVSTFSVNPVDPDILLYNFDLETGTIFSRQPLSVTNQAILGIEFSPDGSKIYYQTNTSSISTLGRYDITTATNQIIDNTRTRYQSDPELGGNGRIYIAGNYVENYISEIADPNNPLLANIQYTRNAYLVNIGGCRPGLSNTIDGEPIGTSNVPTQIDFTYSSLTGCNNFQFFDSSCLGTWQRWDFGDGQFSFNENPIHQYSVSGNYNVTLQVLTCSDTLTITHPLSANISTPILTASPDVTICVGDSTLLTSNGALSYNWSPNIGLSSSTDSIIFAHPTVTTTYTVTGTFSSSCSSTKTITVNTNSANVTITTSTSTPTCAGNSVTLSGSGTTQYLWSTGETSSSINTTSGGVYYLTGFENGCQDIDSITIIANPIPTLSISGAPSIIICNGNNTIIQATGANAYFWSPSVGLSSITDSIVTASPSISTIYTVTGTNQYGCTSSTSISVTPINANVIISTSIDTILCAGESIYLTAQGTNNYLWSTNSTNPTILVSTSGQYVVHGFTNGCSDSDTINVVVNPLPNVILNVPPTIHLCNNSPATIQAFGASTYSWSPSLGLNSTTTSTVVANPSFETIYTVIGTNSYGCSLSQTVDVQPHFITASITSNGTSNFCEGDSVTLNAIGGQSYFWSTNETTSSIVVNTTGNYSVMVSDTFCLDTTFSAINFKPKPVISLTITPNFEICAGDSCLLILNGSPNLNKIWYYNSVPIINQTSDTLIASSSGKYSVQVQSVNGCKNSDSSEVKIFPIPNAQFSSSTLECSPHVNLINLSTNSTNFLWSISSLYQTNTANLSYTFPDTGKYSITLVAFNNFCTDTIITEMNIGRKPLSGFSFDNLCGLSKSFTNYSIGASNYTWLFGDGTSSFLTNPVHAYPSQGNYEVILCTSDNKGCADTIKNKIKIIENIPADFTYTYDTCTKLINYISQNSSDNYYWLLGDGNTSTAVSPTYQYKVPGEYEVTLITNLGTNCSETSKQKINISGTIEKHLYIPNSFTPNADDKNDLFEIVGIENCLEYELQIFNRWGTRIYETKNLHLFWDGIYQGKRVSSGIYPYLLNINDIQIEGKILVLY